MIKKIISWFRNRFVKFIVVKEDTSEVFLSSALFKSIQKDHPGDKTYNVLFSRTRISNQGQHYIFFVNPQWEKHGVSNPKLILTTPISVGKFGHVGFQTIQPSAQELLAVYGKQSTNADKKVIMKVSKQYINAEPFYRIER